MIPSGEALKKGMQLSMKIPHSAISVYYLFNSSRAIFSHSFAYSTAGALINFGYTNDFTALAHSVSGRRRHTCQKFDAVNNLDLYCNHLRFFACPMVSSSITCLFCCQSLSISICFSRSSSYISAGMSDFCAFCP